MSKWIAETLAFVLLCLVAAPVVAADTWSDPAPGIRQLVRTAPGPIRYVAVTVDLGRPEYFIRVTRPEERARTTSAWASQVGAVVAINGDFFDYNGYQPVGLTVGDDAHWSGTVDNGWSFMACTLEKTCVFDDWPQNNARHHRWREVIGGNGWRLLIDGNIPAYPNEGFYLSDRHPRSGVGVSADQKTMVFAVAEGRRGDSIGVTFPEFAQLFKDLGAHNALMLDGGGSSALIVNGARQSQLPSGAGERVVANHVGILRGTPDGLCAGVPNGRFCDGTVIHTCQGGQYRGNGDCGFFGAGCEVTADGVGTCVHPMCTGGANGHYCENETVIGTCDYGAPGGTGDCAFYGATCETGVEDSFCVHFLCTEGGNATWCRDEATVASCVDGQPVEDVGCPDGTVCRDGSCADPPIADEPVGRGGDDVVGSPVGGGETPPTSISSPAPVSDVSLEGEAGCSTTETGASAWWMLLLVAALAGRRRN